MEKTQSFNQGIIAMRKAAAIQNMTATFIREEFNCVKENLPKIVGAMAVDPSGPARAAVMRAANYTSKIIRGTALATSYGADVLQTEKQLAMMKLGGKLKKLNTSMRFNVCLKKLKV